MFATLKGLVSLPRMTSGFIAVLVGYTSSAAIIFQAAQSAGANEAEISSWLWALGIGMAVTSIGLSLRFKTPVLTAWSTPGAALMVTGLSGVSLNEAIGVFLFSSTLILICGLTGWFDRLMRHVPLSLAGAMLAGVLLPFGVDLFIALEQQWLLAGVMLATYLLVKPWLPRYVIPLALVAGLVVAYSQNLMQLEKLNLHPSVPIFTMPEFSLAAIIGVGIPLFIVTMTSQNMPGLAIMRANGYETPVSPIMTTTGIAGIVLAPFGGFAYNLAAISAAICMGEDADPDRSKRYLAAIWSGIFYLLTGIFGATVVSFFSAFPQALIMAIAGLALISTIANSLAGALKEESEREAALICFMITASGISLMGIGSAFWGIVIGMIAYHLRKKV